MPKTRPAAATARVLHDGGPETTRRAKGSATRATAPSTISASQIELWTTKTRMSAGPRAARLQTSVADAPRRRSARETSAPGMKRTSVAATSLSHSPTPSAGSRRATPRSGSDSSRIGAPLAARRSFHTPVPVVGELTKARARHAPRVARVQQHPGRDRAVGPCQGRQRRTGRVLGSRRERSDAGAGAAVVLVPVAVPAPPHLVDPPLGTPGAELRLVMHHLDLREVFDLPSRPSQAKLKVDLLRVEEELLVEEADLVERLAPEEESGTRDPVDLPGRITVRLLHPDPAEGGEPERADERRREAPRRILASSVGIDELRPQRRDARIGVEVRDQAVEAPV